MKRLNYWLIILGLLLLPSFGSGIGLAQSTIQVAPVERPAAALLAGKVGEHAASGAIEQFNQTRLTERLGAQAPIAREFGLESAAARTYRVDKIKLTATVFQFAQPARAYGFYRAWLKPAPVTETYPPHGAITTEGLLFWQASYVVQITAPAAPAGAAAGNERQTLAAALRERIGGESIEPPGLLTHLPKENLIEASTQYFVGPEGLKAFAPQPDAAQIDFTGGTEVALGEYDINGTRGQLMIIEFHTPQQATHGFEQLQSYWQAQPAEQQARSFLKREGNYAIQAVGFADRATAEALANQVEYTYTVKWITKPPKSVFDYGAYREQALGLLVAIFLFVLMAMGVAVLVGVLFGGSLFVRRKARLQQVYSDAGGMIRLNLDRMVGPALSEKSQQLLDKGDQ